MSGLSSHPSRMLEFGAPVANALFCFALFNFSRSLEVSAPVSSVPNSYANFPVMKGHTISPLEDTEARRSSYKRSELFWQFSLSALE